MFEKMSPPPHHENSSQNLYFLHNYIANIVFSFISSLIELYHQPSNYTTLPQYILIINLLPNIIVQT